MSKSSLFVLDKKYFGIEDKEYKNSWLFSPIVWNVLLDKYMWEDIQTPYGYKKNLILNNQELFSKLNNIINNCENLSDRICWELSNQQIFFTKDKSIISKGMQDFLINNTNYDLDKQDSISSLKREHILERWNEVADDIKNINETEYQCFIFKNTSIDDAVECWFTQYDEETDDCKSVSLKELKKDVADFVEIVDDDINFIPNIEFFSKLGWE